MSGYVDIVRLLNGLLSGRAIPTGAGERTGTAGGTDRPGIAEGPDEPSDCPGGIEERDGPSDSPGAIEERDGPSDYKGDPVEPATIAEPDVEPGCTPEEYVRRLLDRNGGCLTQRTVIERLGWSERVGRKLLASMEAGGDVDRHRPPRGKKRVALPGAAPWERPDGTGGD